VLITGLEQGVFPREDKKVDDLEEERRLFYVGVTRAMDELYLTSCAMRRIYGRTSPQEPSLFLREADASQLHILGQAPYRFRPGNTAQGAGAAAISSDGKWRVGERIFHDDLGYGAVTAIKESVSSGDASSDDDEDGPIITVRFDTGLERRFLSRYQSGNYTKIGDDYA
jgi:DNA helicase-2/ATP-dependent DNA helicase PcrA